MNSELFGANYSKIKLCLLVESLAKQMETTVTSGPIKVIENGRRVYVLLHTPVVSMSMGHAV